MNQFVQKYGNPQKKTMNGDSRCFFLEKRDLADYTKVICQFAACICTVTPHKYQGLLNELVIVLNLLRDAVHVWGHRFTNGEPREAVSTMEEEKSEQRSYGLVMMANYFIQELYPVYLTKINWYSPCLTPGPRRHTLT